MMIVNMKEEKALKKLRHAAKEALATMAALDVNLFPAGPEEDYAESDSFCLVRGVYIDASRSIENTIDAINLLAPQLSTKQQPKKAADKAKKAKKGTGKKKT